MAKLPKRMKWLFWEMDFEALDSRRHANYLLGRILEFGRMSEVRWAIRTYGLERIHRFFVEVGSPELSQRTLAFWRTVFKAKDEKWASPPAWRQRTGAPWFD